MSDNELTDSEAPPTKKQRLDEYSVCADILTLDNRFDAHTNNQSINESPLLRYSFVMPLVLKHLDDEDVLVRLVATGKSMKPYLTSWTVKIWSDASNVLDIVTNSPAPYLPIEFEAINIESFDVRKIAKLLPDVKTLSLYGFNEPFDFSQLAPNLTLLSLGWDFDHKFDKSWFPSGLQELEIGRDFTQEILPGSLPDNLKILCLYDCYFPAPKVGWLPAGLLSLDMQIGDHPLSYGMLPDSLQSLTLRGQPDPVELVIPPSVTVLSCPLPYCVITGKTVIPNTVLSLDLGSSFHSEVLRPGLIPPSVKSLDISAFVEPGALPPSVERLVMDWDHEQPLPVGFIPPSVTNLTLRASSVTPGAIPDSVVELTFKAFFDTSGFILLPGVIPSSVKRLGFDTSYNHPIFPGVIPESVTHVTFGWLNPSSFNQPLYQCFQTFPVQGTDTRSLACMKVFPDSVIQISFGAAFDQPVLPGSLPSSLLDLTFGDAFNQKLLPGSIPDTVIHLRFGKSFQQNLTRDLLPNSLRVLTLPYVSFPSVELGSLKAVVSEWRGQQPPIIQICHM